MRRLRHAQRVPSDTGSCVRSCAHVVSSGRSSVSHSPTSRRNSTRSRSARWWWERCINDVSLRCISEGGRIYRASSVLVTTASGE